MENGLPDDETIRTAIALAIRAPSVHNSQPWRWRIGDNTVHLFADPRVHLRQADPDRRDLIISCGAALQHFRVACAALGWHAKVHRYPNPADVDHVASIELQRRISTEHDIALAAAIPRRRTDRRRYSSWPVPAGHLALMAARAASEGVVLYRAEALIWLERAIEKAAAIHAVDNDYQAELKIWSGRRGSLDGVPASSTPATTAADRIHARVFADPRLEQPMGVGPQNDAAELLVLATPSDDPLSRLRAGEATSAVLLTATTLGLASCPLTEPLEVPETRAIVRAQVLDDSGFPQMVLRVGWASINADPLPATPRHSPDEVIDPLDPASGRTGRRKDVIT